MSTESGRLTCDNCKVDFEITVEPGVPEVTAQKEYPGSIEWLEKIQNDECYCPGCGELIEL